MSAKEGAKESAKNAKIAVSAPSWLTAKADAASLPALMENLGAQIDTAAIDELWVFPTQRSAGVESTVFVLSFFEEDDKMRRVDTAHFRTTRNKRGEPTIDMKLVEHAVAEAERIPRVIEGVLKRMDDFAAAPPSYARIEKNPERWNQVVEELTNLKPNETLPETLLQEDRKSSETLVEEDKKSDELVD